jgi:hypothetical protein
MAPVWSVHDAPLIIFQPEENPTGRKQKTAEEDF